MTNMSNRIDLNSYSIRLDTNRTHEYSKFADSTAALVSPYHLPLVNRLRSNQTGSTFSFSYCVL